MKKTIFLLVLLPGLIRAAEVYFSAEGNVRHQIIKRVNQSRVSIEVAMYSFTSGELAQALADAAKRGVKVRVVRDFSQSANKGDENAFLRESQVALHVVKGRGRGIMHHKFAIFDGKEGLTGSYNWSQSAEQDHEENVLFFTDPGSVRAYQAEFERLWRKPPAGDVPRSPLKIPGMSPSYLWGALALAMVALLISFFT